MDLPAITPIYVQKSLLLENAKAIKNSAEKSHPTANEPLEFKIDKHWE